MNASARKYESSSPRSSKYSTDKVVELDRGKLQRSIVKYKLFFVVLALIPIYFAVNCFWKVYTVQHTWKQVTAAVDSSHIVAVETRGGTHYALSINYHYLIDGVIYSGEDSKNREQNREAFKDRTITAFCNPTTPAESLLFPDRFLITGFWILFCAAPLFPIVFMNEPDMTQRYNSGLPGRQYYDHHTNLARQIIASRHPIAGVDRT